MKRQVTFESDFFKPVAGEEEKTNPGVFGQALAEWLQVQLRNRGVEIEGVIPEDFGWVVMISRKPFMVWLGCGNTEGSTREWNVYPAVEPSLVQRLFKRYATEPAVQALWEHVKAIVPTIPAVKAIRWE